jgi:hypothetical protein
MALAERMAGMIQLGYDVQKAGTRISYVIYEGTYAKDLGITGERLRELKVKSEDGVWFLPQTRETLEFVIKAATEQLKDTVE